MSNFDHIGGVVKGPHIVEALYLKGMGGGSHKCFKVLSLQHALISMSSFVEAKEYVAPWYPVRSKELDHYVHKGLAAPPS